MIQVPTSIRATFDVYDAFIWRVGLIARAVYHDNPEALLATEVCFTLTPCNSQRYVLISKH